MQRNIDNIRALIPALLLVGTAGLSACSTTKSADKQKEQTQQDGARKAEQQKEVAPSDKADSVNVFELDGLKVLHRPTPANQVVSANLYIDGGVTNFSEDKAGIEQLALSVAVNGGTKSTPKDDFNSRLYATGSSVSYSVNRDYASYSLHTVLEHVDKTWPLFAQAISEPEMPESEIQTQREQQIASVRQISENPNRFISYTGRKLLSAGHPYGKFQHGTIDNLKTFAREDLVEYHQSLLNPDRMLLVIVGDLSKNEAKSRASALRNQLPEAHSYDRPKLKPLGGSDERFALKEKSFKTNYVLGLFRGPEPTSDDFAALRLGLAYLSDQFFVEIRTKRNLSYAAAAGLSGYRAAYGYIYTSTRQPKKAVGVMFREINKLKQKPISEQKLKETRNVFITRHFQSMETNAGLAGSLADAELTEGDWRRHYSFEKRYRSVTPKEIQQAAKKYLTDFHFAVAGSKDALNRNFYKPGSE